MYNVHSLKQGVTIRYRHRFFDQDGLKPRMHLLEIVQLARTVLGRWVISLKTWALAKLFV